MSILHLKQLAKRLKDGYSARIDLGDLAKKPDAELEHNFCSRALALFALEGLSGKSVPNEAVTDGFNDNGLDAIFCDTEQNRLWLIQTKWIHAAKGEPGAKEVSALVQGVHDLLKPNWSRFNEKIMRWQTAILNLVNIPGMQLHVVLAFTGDTFSTHSARLIDDLREAYNDISEVLIFHRFDLKALYELLTRELSGPQINETLQLHDWGFHAQPYQAFYGCMGVRDVRTLWQKHERHILRSNIRDFVGTTEVNDSIKKSILEDPDSFFYKNNGITILADSVRKLVAGSADRSLGQFVCNNMSVINGAQTLGIIGGLTNRQAEDVSRARVLCRIISSEDTQPSFGEAVTRACNTQNTITAKDFLALDEIQKRLDKEFQLMGIKYVYRSGDTYPTGTNFCTLEESAVSLACSSGDLSLSVLSKREVGRLWLDIGRPPYRTLFNDQLSASEVWVRIVFKRLVDQQLRFWELSDDASLSSVAVHGNRFLLYLLFQKFRDEVSNAEYDDPKYDDLKIKAEIKELLLLVRQCIDASYPGAYLASLFKNGSKVQELRDTLNAWEGGKQEQFKFKT